MSESENNLEKEGGFLAKASYSLFDVGNSAVGAMHATFIFAVYFASVVAPENGTSYWGYTTTLSKCSSFYWSSGKYTFVES